MAEFFKSNPILRTKFSKNTINDPVNKQLFNKETVAIIEIIIWKQSK